MVCRLFNLSTNLPLSTSANLSVIQGTYNSSRDWVKKGTEVQDRHI